MTVDLHAVRLRERIDGGTAIVSVVGLGYVGLAVACEFARVGFRVVGLDIDQGRVATISAGHSPIDGDEPGLAESLSEVVKSGKLTATSDYSALHEADVVLICVDTPVDADHSPKYEALRAVARSLGAVLRRGMLVVVESTVSPGTTDGIVRPILEQESGMRCGSDFALGACPERVMPGKLLKNLRTVGRVCGGKRPKPLKLCVPSIATSCAPIWI